MQLISSIFQNHRLSAITTTNDATTTNQLTMVTNDLAIDNSSTTSTNQLTTTTTTTNDLITLDNHSTTSTNNLTTLDNSSTTIQNHLEIMKHNAAIATTAISKNMTGNRKTIFFFLNAICMYFQRNSSRAYRFTFSRCYSLALTYSYLKKYKINRFVLLQS